MSASRTLAVFTACVMALTACAEERDSEDWAENQVNGQVGAVRLINAYVEAPPMAEQQVGGNLPLYLTLANESDQEQVLDAVSTVEAKKVVYVEGGAPPVEQIRLTIPPRGQLSLQQGQDRPHLELQGTNRQLGATPFPVTFRFPTAGSITIRVPVRPVGSPTPS